MLEARFTATVRGCLFLHVADDSIHRLVGLFKERLQDLLALQLELLNHFPKGFLSLFKGCLPGLTRECCVMTKLVLFHGEVGDIRNIVPEDVHVKRILDGDDSVVIVSHWNFYLENGLKTDAHLVKKCD